MSMSPAVMVRAGSPIAVTRHFTTPGGDPYAGIKWARFTSKITEKDGTVVFEMKDVEAPDFWSQRAVDIAASKYFRKAGVPGTGHERSVRQLIDRIAITLATQGVIQGHLDEESAATLRDELTYLLVHQHVAFNSPVWFNTGLAERYGATGSSAGNWAIDLDSRRAVETTDMYTRPPLSACFIQTVDDSLKDIWEAVGREMRVFKGGGGSGMNYSKIRAESEPLSGGGQSSGLMSFLEIFDKAAGATKSGGTTRRAARMVVLNADHPDIETFIDWKVREEKKVAALVRAGYSSDFQGEAYRTVSGQNANNSVRVTDDFMKAVVEDGDWATTWRTTGKVAKTMKARALMRKIAEAAHSCADPGLQFDTTANAWNPTPNTARINASNPCAEYVYVDDSACNLASINLVKFLRTGPGTADHPFDIEGYRQAVDVFITAMDIIVDYASYPTQRIAENSHALRPLGLGYANLGALLMRLGLPYDSQQARAVCALLTSLMTGRAYRRSAELAKTVGPFSGFAFNREPMLKVVSKHANAMNGVVADNTDRLCADLRRAAGEDWADAYSLGQAHGFRNGQATLLAPTGTIGLLMDCDTTGIEPDFSLVKSKKLAGGGNMKIVNQSIGPALGFLGYRNAEIDEILKHVDKHDTIEGAPYIKPEHLPVFDCAVRCGATGKRVIAPKAHITMMAAAQPFLSGAISKTVNCPEETTVDEIYDLYMMAWRLGLKAIAVYREESKLCAILSSSSAEKPAAAIQHAPAPAVTAPAVPVLPAPTGFVRPIRRRLPKRRLGFTQEVVIGGSKLYVRTGTYEDGSLGEIFLDMSMEGSTMRSLLNSFARAISLALQHGVPLEEFIGTFVHTKFEPRGIVNGDSTVRTTTSILDYVFRMLAIEYLGRHDLANKAPKSNGQPQPQVNGNGNGHVKLTDLGREAVDAILAEKPGAQVTNAAGEPCGNCGDITIKAGTCSVCPNCGTTTGCG